MAGKLGTEIAFRSRRQGKTSRSPDLIDGLTVKSDLSLPFHHHNHIHGEGWLSLVVSKHGPEYRVAQY